MRSCSTKYGSKNLTVEEQCAIINLDENSRRFESRILVQSTREEKQNDSGNMKGYNTSKFEKKEKSGEKLPKRQDSAPTSKFPRAKKNATLHPNLRDQKHYNARTKELIAVRKGRC
jgi:hypothetical protein